MSASDGDVRHQRELARYNPLGRAIWTSLVLGFSGEASTPPW